MHELEELYCQIAPKLLSYLRQLTNNSYLAEEILQQTFLRATEHLLVSNLELKPAWFYKVGRHLYLDEVRRRGRLVPLDAVSESIDYASSPAINVEKKETELIVLRALRRTPDNYRELLILREFEELTYQEITEVTGLSLDQVKVGIFRARQHLRNLLEREEIR